MKLFPVTTPPNLFFSWWPFRFSQNDFDDMVASVIKVLNVMIIGEIILMSVGVNSLSHSHNIIHDDEHSNALP